MTRSIGIEIFYWIDNWQDNQAAWFEKAKSCGFDSVEMSLVNGPETNVGEMRAEADRLGLDLYCSMGLPAEMDITSPDETIRQRGITYLKACVDAAHRVGSPILGGVPYAPWLFFPDASDLEPYRERAATALAEVAQVAHDLGITITLELLNRFETWIFNCVDEGLNFLKRVDHPNVKLQLDTYHMNMEEDNLADAIRKAGDQLGHFHCAASNRKLPGRGHIDWPAIKVAFDEINYKRGVIIETFPNPNAETGRTINTWRPLVENYDAEVVEALRFLQTTMA
ncbi:MAG: sugar phosphate isomerase/epimerase family protein [Chloroflexota bacterium]